MGTHCQTIFKAARMAVRCHMPAPMPSNFPINAMEGACWIGSKPPIFPSFSSAEQIASWSGACAADLPLEMLGEAGNRQNYIYYLQVLGDDPERGMRKIMSATVRRLKYGVHPGVPKDAKLLTSDVFAVNPNLPEEGTVGEEELQHYGLQRGPMGLPERLGKVRRLASRESRVEERTPEEPTAWGEDPRPHPCRRAV